MSYSTIFKALKTELETSTHFEGYPVKVLTRIEGRNSISINSAFGVEICVPDGIFTTNDNETVTDNVTTADFGVADMEMHTFLLRCRELRMNRPDHGELFDPDEKTILTLVDKVKNALADFHYKNTPTYLGFEYGPVSMVNLPDGQAEWVAEFDFRIVEQVEVRAR